LLNITILKKPKYYVTQKVPVFQLFSGNSAFLPDIPLANFKTILLKNHEPSDQYQVVRTVHKPKVFLFLHFCNYIS